MQTNIEMMLWKVTTLYTYANKYAGLTDHEKQREALGVKLPDAPDYSYVANAILCAYNTIARSRRYEQGVPLALDISAINAYVEQYDLPVERYIFNDCIFTLDDMFLDEAHKKSRKITATSNGGFYCAFINQLVNRGIVEITMPLSLNYLERYHSIV